MCVPIGRLLTSMPLLRPQIAEWVIGTWLSHEHHFQVYAEQQKQELWRPRLEMEVNVSTGRRM